MTTMLMLLFGLAIFQAAARMLAAELSLVSVLACLAGLALIIRGVARVLVWIAPRSS